MTDMLERPVIFSCRGERLLGILHRPPAADRGGCGLVLVVGGPQYRVGSHRLFVTLARALAARGIPVLRFDYRGQGDSPGAHPGFENVAPDIEAAIDLFMKEEPGLERVALWGLCDAASAIAVYGSRDVRVAGIALINPWVREAESFDETLLRHYYGRRALSRDFWRRFLAGRTDAGDFLRRLARWLAGGIGKRDNRSRQTLPDKIAEGLRRFHGSTLLVLSGNDLTAREFESKLSRLAAWREISARGTFERLDLPDADHTFAQSDWSRELCERTAAWLKRL